MNKINFTALLMGAGLLIGTPLTALAVCKVSVTATAPDSRYTKNGNGTITDRVTGLIWKQCSEGQSTTTTACDTGAVISYSWQGALQQTQALNTGGGFAGATDWRLPNRNELASLVERQCYAPAINVNLFPYTEPGYYWSSSPSIGNSGYAWGVNFSSGSVAPNSPKSYAANVRLVRGGF